VADPKRILVVRLTAIGDVVHTLPVLSALREHFPKSHLAWAVEGGAGSLLEDHPELDELIRLPRRWLKSPGEVLKLRRRFRAAPFDVAIDVQGLSKSAVVSLLSGAKNRISHAHGQARELSPWIANQRVRGRREHVVDRNLELLRPLGIHSPQVKFIVPGDMQAEGKVAQWQRAGKIPERFSLLNPGAGWPSKIWPAERFAEVAKHLGKQGLMSVVLWAGEQEKKWASQIVRQSRGHADLAPATSLRELATLCRCATLFVASDTGPLHLAAATGTPCVGLFGPMPAKRNSPYGKEHIAIQQVCLTGSSRRRRNANDSSMRAISVEAVQAGCDQLLSQERDARQTIPGTHISGSQRFVA